MTNRSQRTRLITTSTDKHYSLDSEDDFCSGCQNVSHQQQFFLELHSPGRSHNTNYWYSWVQTIYYVMYHLSERKEWKSRRKTFFVWENFHVPKNWPGQQVHARLERQYHRPESFTKRASWFNHKPPGMSYASLEAHWNCLPKFWSVYRELSSNTSQKAGFCMAFWGWFE